MAANDFFHKYPYTDFHELNLDWVLEELKKYYTYIKYLQNAISVPNEGDNERYSANYEKDDLFWWNDELYIVTNSDGVNAGAIISTSDCRLVSIDELLQNETAARQAADTALQNALNTESATREQADNDLSTAITTERAARISADNTLQANIDAEAATREAADNELRALLAEGEGGAEKLYIKGGSYQKGSYSTAPALYQAGDTCKYIAQNTSENEVNSILIIPGITDAFVGVMTTTSKNIVRNILSEGNVPIYPGISSNSALQTPNSVGYNLFINDSTNNQGIFVIKQPANSTMSIYWAKEPAPTSGDGYTSLTVTDSTATITDVKDGLCFVGYGSYSEGDKQAILAGGEVKYSTFPSSVTISYDDSTQIWTLSGVSSGDSLRYSYLGTYEETAE